MANKVFAGVDDVQAKFWNSPITRLEAQKIFDDFANALVGIKEQLLKLDFAVGYLLEKGGVKPEDVKEFMDRKMVEYAEQVKAEEQAAKKAIESAPAVSGKVTLT
jgi:hypothetical protein